MKNSKGFTLIEVLVAALIIMLGVTGYVTLQSVYIKSDAKTNQRSVAMQLAQEKLEELRSFTAIQAAPGEFAFADIADNAGGTIASGDVDVSLTEDADRVYTFNRTWDVTSQYYVDTDADGQPDSWLNSGDANLPAVLPPWPAQKQVTVTVTWSDPQGESHSVALQASLAPVTQAASYQAINESDNAKASPTVSYTPGLAPDVIAYDLGDNQKVETSKPVPEVTKQGDNTQVQFETVKYIELPDDVTKLEQEDFLTVDCECKIAGTGSGATPHMTILVDGELMVQPGEMISKTTGVPASDKQPALCTQCCRDHHDTVTMVSNEEHYRAEDGAPHKHYLNDGAGNFSLASSVGDAYNEACRFKRVNGLFQLYPDWQLLDIIEFDDQYLFGDGKLSAYTNYTESLISKRIQGLTSPAKPADRDITVAPGAYQMIARGVYLDRMKSEHKQQVLDKIADGDESWKAITPFYDINLTLLANWSTQVPEVASITQETIQTLVDPANNYYGTYSRGRLEALSQGTSTVAVNAYPHNAGITGGKALSPVEYSGVIIDNSVTVEVDPKTAIEKYWGIIGDINCTLVVGGATQACELNNNKKADYVDLATMQITASPEHFACTITIPKGNATPFFSCDDVSEKWTGSLTFTFSKPDYGVTMQIQYPDNSVVESNQLTLSEGLSATSNREYNLILTLTK
ncbi:prepilin-type N-terminal cleavage/methylation domain-containing protein [Lacimicrobium sp. SS2-24]|uniref:prepilin-type N-terminal cleavage/methylation domain-containing protein n=1 Tax=Lacimicrobium sp. SS2-24 TaxID=2005569 RepID=UPI00143890A5|nr:prepilin-type N-terminal cleavage/methylation domain-containing protein [Lacimicrobium sp. SS2-24]